MPKKEKSVIIKISLIFKNLCKSVLICGQQKHLWTTKTSVDNKRNLWMKVVTDDR